MTIKHFAQGYGFLSNNHRKPILFEGDTYKTVTHAYEAARMSKDNPYGIEYRKYVRNTFNIIEARRVGSSATTRRDWSQYKLIVMPQLIEIKFSHKILAHLLRETWPVDLEYGNLWHDTFWGICHCPACKETGENRLGKIIMELRDKLLT